MSFILELVPSPPGAKEAFYQTSRSEKAIRLQIFFEPGYTVAQAVYLSGYFPPPSLCSGIALCGRCKMRFTNNAPEASEAETHFFSSHDLNNGWRLTCRHQARAGMVLCLPYETARHTLPLVEETDGYEPARTGIPTVGEENQASSPQDCVMALDYGTTSLWWTVHPSSSTRHEQPPIPEPACLCSGSRNNPQLGAGGDVVSRIAASRGGGIRRMQALSLSGIESCIHDAHTACRGAIRISSVCIAGNTAMTSIILGKDVESLAMAPYRCPYKGGTWEQVNSLPAVYVPPQLSPFVGGDISAGYAYLAFNPEGNRPEYPFLLADMGTNGEFLLALSEKKSLTASVALGPALEGIGLSQGTDARPGAITGFTLSPRGLIADFFEAEPANASSMAAPSLTLASSSPAPIKDSQASTLTESTTAPAGITGTGYISLLAILLRTGVLTSEGAFSLNHTGPLRRLLTPCVDERGEPYLELPYSLTLPARDVEEILKVKAAFSLGLHRLLCTAGIESRSLAHVFVAGALGRHIRKDDLETLGLFPPGMGRRIQTIGNSSLGGASVLIRNESSRKALERWSDGVETVDLSADPTFSSEFIDHMRFTW